MIYELDNGKLKKLNDNGVLIKDNHILNQIYTTNLNDDTMLIIDSNKNKCYIVSKDIINNGIPQNLYKNLVKKEKRHVHTSSDVTFIIAMSYNCNLHCTYCYQQHDKALDKKLISKDSLNNILNVIEKYMNKNPDKNIELGLFGGEPLLRQNEPIIDLILSFCKKHGIRVHITTNGYNLDYFLKKIIINRRIISSINPTIDSLKLNYVTRKNLSNDKNCNEETTKLILCIKTLLNYGINVNVATNVDKHNYKDIWKTYDDFCELELMQNKFFTWSIGRVDDRLYETNYPDIIHESEIITELLNHEIPANMHIAFLKTTYNLVIKMGLKLNQKELKGEHNYCWNSSTLDNVFYVDSSLRTFRCTYTVGRPNHSLFKFSLDNIESYKANNITNESYKECIGCKIGGYCGGGCQLSHKTDFDRCCSYEQETFEMFLNKIFIPYIKKLYCEEINNES